MEVATSSPSGHLGFSTVLKYCSLSAFSRCLLQTFITPLTFNLNVLIIRSELFQIRQVNYTYTNNGSRNNNNTVILLLSNLSHFVFVVLTTEYKRVIIFKGPMADRRLPGHVIRTESVANEGGCRVKCFLEPNCLSINVGPPVGGKRSCELNNATDESPEMSTLKGDSDYIHYAVEVIR